MSAFRRLHFGLILVLLITANHAIAQTKPLLPEDERTAIKALVEKLANLGMPDSKGGSFFVGTGTILQRFDPTAKSAALPMRYCGKQSTVPGSKEVEYVYTVEGPHLRLSDGSWLVGLEYPVKPEKGLEVSTDELEARELEHAREKAEAKHALPADEKLDKWFANVAPDKREAMKAGAKQALPLWQYFDLYPVESTLGTYYLLRAGVEDASALTYVTADARCRDYWRMRYWDEKAYPFDPTGEYAGLAELTEKWPPNDEPFPAEAPSVAFRRDLHRRFFHLLRSSESTLPDDRLAALAYATIDPNDPQRIKKRIDGMVAARKIAKRPAKDADLVARLMSWGAPDPQEQSNFQVINSGDDQNPSITTVFAAPESAYTPAREDLPKLFALLDDDRPTRWVDFQGARSVGENALRAISMIMEKNALELVDRADLEPWTPERRKEANRTLVKWWEANGREYLSKSKN